MPTAFTLDLPNASPVVFNHRRKDSPPVILLSSGIRFGLNNSSKDFGPGSVPPKSPRPVHVRKEPPQQKTNKPPSKPVASAPLNTPRQRRPSPITGAPTPAPPQPPPSLPTARSPPTPPVIVVPSISVNSSAETTKYPPSSSAARSALLHICQDCRYAGDSDLRFQAHLKEARHVHHFRNMAYQDPRKRQVWLKVWLSSLEAAEEENKWAFEMEEEAEEESAVEWGRMQGRSRSRVT